MVPPAGQHRSSESTKSILEGVPANDGRACTSRGAEGFSHLQACRRCRGDCRGDQEQRARRGAGDRGRRDQPGGQSHRHLARVRRSRRSRPGLHPRLHRHIHRRRGAHWNPIVGGEPLTPETGRARSFHIWTIGCQMNTADSESLARKLLAAGYVEDSLDRADVAILNTCVVRQASEDRVYAKLHELKEWKTPERTVAVTGCIVAKEGTQLGRRFPTLDPMVVPIGEYDAFVADLDARYDYSQGEPLPPAGRTGVSHFVRVIQGCDHNCTFCIVPKVRGRERHIALTAVVAECCEAVAAGAKEVVLLGQNVDDYRDPDGEGGLATLVTAVERIPGLKRLRFMTSHPQDLEPRLLEVMAASDVICRELQLPVQSGDDGILKRMARGYQTRH